LKVNQARRLGKLELGNVKLKRLVSELSLEKVALKDIASKLLSPERRACRVVKQPRGTQRYWPTQ
jgi:hypothetical protein